MAETLKPCPLCGRKAHVIRICHTSGSSYNVYCGDDMFDSCCLVLFGGNETRKQLVEKWNTRVTDTLSKKKKAQ